MADYGEKIPYAGLGAAARNTAPQTPNEASMIESELNEIAALVDGVEASVAYARSKLWGPIAEKADRAGPSVVEPSGFLPSTLHRVRVIRHRLQALTEAAGNLRNI